MAFQLVANDGTQHTRMKSIPQDVWAGVRDEVTRLYMTEQKTLRMVMSCMELDGFTATYDLNYLPCTNDYDQFSSLRTHG
jgi:hypothetical protein